MRRGGAHRVHSSGTHRYIFSVHALDSRVVVNTSQQVVDEVIAHTSSGEDHGSGVLSPRDDVIAATLRSMPSPVVGHQPHLRAGSGRTARHPHAVCAVRHALQLVGQSLYGRHVPLL